jgi:hypothetical protein
MIRHIFLTQAFYANKYRQVLEIILIFVGIENNRRSSIAIISIRVGQCISRGKKVGSNSLQTSFRFVRVESPHGLFAENALTWMDGESLHCFALFTQRAFDNGNVGFFSQSKRFS